LGILLLENYEKQILKRIPSKERSSLNMCPVLCFNKYDEHHPCPDKSMLTSMRFKGRQPGLDLI